MTNLNLEVSNLRLNDGTEIPMLGYGTGSAMFKRENVDKIDRVRVEQIKAAIKAGYHHLDGAEVYKTEPELGTAIRESKVPRDQLFVTTKVSPNIKDIPGAISASLKKLGLDYVDLYLIHEPFFAEGDEDLQRAWAEMEKVKAAGQAKSIGVSNFNEKHLQAIMKTGKEIPSVNQTEFHAYLQRGQLRQFCQSHGIALSAYGPLTPILKGRPGPLDDMLAQLAKKYAVNEGEILLRWCVELNVVPVTTSTNEQRLSDMLRIFAFKMTPKEVEDLSKTGLEKNVRRFWPDKYAADDFE